MELFFATVSLFVVTIVGSFIYYKRIRRAQIEYEGSKDLVRSITFGFTQQLSRFSRTIGSLRQEVLGAHNIASEALKASRDAKEVMREGREETEKISKRVDEAEKVFDSMRQEMQELVSRKVVHAVKTEVEAPIPLKQEAVLDMLTQTELVVLTFIEEMGEGSVPEIRKRIGKTREHTARLLKKLF